MRFASETNTQMSSGSGLRRLYYKAFAEAKPSALSQRLERNHADRICRNDRNRLGRPKACLGDANRNIESRDGPIDHTPEAIDVWAAELRMRFGGQSIAIALEQSRGPLVFMLTKYEHLVIFPVHPTMLVNYRKSFRPSGAKDDPSDARLLLDILMLHRDKLRRFNPDTPETRTLQFLVEERRKFVHEKTRYSNRLTAHLKMYFPQVLDWFDEIGSNIAAEFLERWPSLDKLQRARPATIERFFIDHNSRDPDRIKDRLDQIRKAVPATTDTAVLTSSSAAIGRVGRSAEATSSCNRCL